MWRTNGCPRCDSDTLVYQTVSGNQYEECFRCGYRRKLGGTTEGKGAGEGILEKTEEYVLIEE